LKLAQKIRTQETNKHLNENYQNCTRNLGTMKGLTFIVKKFTSQRQLKEYRNCSKTADIRTNYEIAQKQIEVDLLNQQKQIKRQY
jgi:hypothetical protein